MTEPIAFIAILVALIVFGAIAAALGGMRTARTVRNHDIMTERRFTQLLHALTMESDCIQEETRKAHEAAIATVREEAQRLTERLDRATVKMPDTITASAQSQEAEPTYTKEQLQKVITWAKLRDQQREKRMQETLRKEQEETKPQEAPKDKLVPHPSWYEQIDSGVEEPEEPVDEVRPPPAQTPMTTFDDVLRRYNRGKEATREPQED